MSNRGASFFAFCLRMTYHAIEYTPHRGTNLSHPSFPGYWLKNKLVILRFPFSCDLNNLVTTRAIKFKWVYGTIDENRPMAVS